MTTLSFPCGDVNNFVVGSEEGAVYTACRHGSRAGVMDVFEGHQVMTGGRPRRVWQNLVQLLLPQRAQIGQVFFFCCCCLVWAKLATLRYGVKILASLDIQRRQDLHQDVLLFGPFLTLSFFLSFFLSSSPQAPVTGLDTHPSTGNLDFGHLFVTSSMDWTIKLWSLKENRPMHSFEDNGDYVYDVAW